MAINVFELIADFIWDVVFDRPTSAVKNHRKKGGFFSLLLTFLQLLLLAFIGIYLYGLIFID